MFRQRGHLHQRRREFAVVAVDLGRSHWRACLRDICFAFAVAVAGCDLSVAVDHHDDLVRVRELGWTWLWYVAGIVTGATIIFMFAVFEKKRSEVLRVVEA
jgi:hypothetical protein